MKNWIAAARPKTWPAALVPVWAGCVLAWKLQGHWSPLLAVVTVMAAVFIQIATNFFNDALDADKGADTAKRLGPQRASASGLIPRRSIYIAGSAFLIAAAGCGWYLYLAAGWPILLIGIPSLYLAYGYTGGPFPLAYRGMGEVFVVGFFGIIAVAGTVLIQMQEWREEAVLLGFQIGLLSAVLISINNLRDRAEDATTGKNTLAVRMGEMGAKILIWLEIKVAIFASLFWLKYQLPWCVLASLPLLTLGFIILWKIFTSPADARLNRYLALSAVMLLLFALSFQITCWL